MVFDWLTLPKTKTPIHFSMAELSLASERFCFASVAEIELFS